MAFDHRVAARFSLIVLMALGVSDSLARPPYGKLQVEQKFKDYTVRIYRVVDDISTKDGLGCFEILKSGKQVYFQEGYKFTVGNAIYEGEPYTNDWLKIGQSITSDRQPNLVISEWTGGAHCCFTF